MLIPLLLQMKAITKQLDKYRKSMFCPALLAVLAVDNICKPYLDKEKENLTELKKNSNWRNLTLNIGSFYVALLKL